MSIDRTVGVGGVTIGLIGTGIVVLWPDKRWIGWVFIALGLLIAVLAIVWALAAHHTRRELEADQKKPAWIRDAELINAPITNTNNPIFAPVFAPSFSHSPTQSQRQQQTRDVPRAPSIFEATDNARIVTYGLDGRDGKLIHERYYGDEADLPEYIGLVHTALAQFHYRHDANVEPRLSLAAHIFPYSKNQLPIKPIVYHAVWNNADYDRQIEVLPGKVFDLIVALFKRQDAKGIHLYEHGTEKIDFGYGDMSRFKPELHRVEGTDFFIKIELAPKCWSDPLPKQEFWFRLILGEPPEFAKLDRSPLDISTDMKMTY
jgi:hypothetical protein